MPLELHRLHPKVMWKELLETHLSFSVILGFYKQNRVQKTGNAFTVCKLSTSSMVNLILCFVQKMDLCCSTVSWTYLTCRFRSHIKTFYRVTTSSPRNNKEVLSIGDNLREVFLQLKYRSILGKSLIWRSISNQT